MPERCRTEATRSARECPDSREPSGETARAERVQSAHSPRDAVVTLLCERV